MKSLMEMMTYDKQLITEDLYLNQYDYLITAPNIELRSRAFYKLAVKKKCVDKVIVADYDNFHKSINPESERTYWDDFIGVNYVAISINSDEELLIELENMHIDNKKKIGLDITGFSIPAIYVVMDYLKNDLGVTELDVFYTEPKNYVYENGHLDSYHKRRVSNRRCKSIPEYYNMGRKQNEILTIFLGFDDDLASEVHNKMGESGVETIKTIVVNGFPSYTAKLKDVSLLNNRNIINLIGEKNVYPATANNPFDVYNVLCKIKNEHKGVLLNLCSIGSKPMALGACLFALDNKQLVKVTYPYYTKTRFDISEEVGKIWRYGVNFNNIAL